MANSELQRDGSEFLDSEIASLEARANALCKQLEIVTSTILSSSSTQQAIQERTPSSQSIQRSRNGSLPPSSALVDRSTKQRAHMQRILYRTTTPITAFKVRDPDPNAVDGGHILGLRFEVMTCGRFLQPYYVMLNRPYPKSTYLRVHRHTIPPAVPLNGLAARHLPSPAESVSSDSPPKQDLDKFVRALRREIVRYHNRLGVAADLRRKLAPANGTKEPTSPNNNNGSDAQGVVDVGIVDIQGKQVKITWGDGRNGRLVMDDDGKVEKFMVFSDAGRDWEMTREMLGDLEHVDDVTKKLEEFAAAGTGN